MVISPFLTRDMLVVYLVLFCFFFFQAEDGIRDWRDWSSDVCSSDLPGSQRQHWRSTLHSQRTTGGIMNTFRNFDYCPYDGIVARADCVSAAKLNEVVDRLGPACETILRDEAAFGIVACFASFRPGPVAGALDGSLRPRNRGDFTHTGLPGGGAGAGARRQRH